MSLELQWKASDSYFFDVHEEWDCVLVCCKEKDEIFVEQSTAYAETWRITDDGNYYQSRFGRTDWKFCVIHSLQYCRGVEFVF